MDANGLRAAFTRFFADRGHTVVPSASLIPHDPSVLFTIAGMVPFKPYFLGEEQAPWPRATSIQKCFRTPDIDIIGTDTYHCTFFEMLGNFSFGDYFKAEAIPMAWELLTEVFGFDGDRLWVTVHEGDDEAEQIWIDSVGVRPERIQRMGDEDNFWAMGETGPCGPDSEIFIDKGPGYGEDGGPKHGGDQRFVELWNLVFMQFNRDAEGTLTELPRKNIDTGAGFERILPVLQGHDSIFDTELFVPIIDAAASVIGTGYGSDERTDVSLRVLADHGRAMTMLVADGVLPANEGRGYVLRRVVRRAVMAARRLGVDKPIGPTLVQAATEVLGEAWPALVGQHDLIVNVVAREEAGFDRTLRAGLGRLEEAFATGAKVLPGDVAFTLHDTHGFPVELTEELARDAGVEVDRAGFDAAMREQRERARAAAKSTRAGDEAAYRALLESEGQTAFVGRGLENYESPGPGAGRARGRRRRRRGFGRDLLGPHPLLRRGRWPDGRHRHHRHRVGHRRRLRHRVRRARADRAQGPGGRRARGRPGRRWPPSTASAARPSGATTPPPTSALGAAHRAGRPRAPAGIAGLARVPALRLLAPRPADARGARRGLRSGQCRRAEPTSGWRRWRQRATRRRRWGPSPSSATSTARPCGWSGPGRPRSSSAAAPTSTRSGQIGPITLLSEGSIGSNTRRIFAVTGKVAIERAKERERLVRAASELLRSEPDELVAAIGRTLERQRDGERELAKLRQQSSEAEAGTLAAQAAADGGVVVARRDNVDGKALQNLAQAVLRHDGVRAVVLAGSPDGTKVAIAAATGGEPDATAAGQDAGPARGRRWRRLSRGGAGRRQGPLADRGRAGRGAATPLRVSGGGAGTGKARGRVAAIDLGARRIGIAYSDSGRTLASPWGTDRAQRRRRP